MRLAILLTILAFALFLYFRPHTDWSTASRDSVGIAPNPKTEKRAIVQVYAARAFDWRGYFALHTWIATKEKDAKSYTVYQVTGWRQWRNLPAVSAEPGIPDGKWYGNTPEMLFELKGAPAEKMIPQIAQASKDYPYQNFYRLYPGPNSNTFISYIIRHTPGMYVELPPHAIGKDWIDDGKFFGPSETGTGYQFSLYGLLGLTIGKAEGIEINILGMTFGVDVLSPALKLPFIGRVGMKDRPVYGPSTEPEIKKSSKEEDPKVTPGEIDLKK